MIVTWSARRLQPLSRRVRRTPIIRSCADVSCRRSGRSEQPVMRIGRSRLAAPPGRAWAAGDVRKYVDHSWLGSQAWARISLTGASRAAGRETMRTRMRTLRIGAREFRRTAEPCSFTGSGRTITGASGCACGAAGKAARAARGPGIRQSVTMGRRTGFRLSHPGCRARRHRLRPRSRMGPCAVTGGRHELGPVLNWRSRASASLTSSGACSTSQADCRWRRRLPGAGNHGGQPGHVQRRTRDKPMPGQSSAPRGDAPNRLLPEPFSPVWLEILR
jgi:hypothetical protein